jgi:hypothetical protein
LVEAVTVERAGGHDWPAYDAFVRGVPEALLYHGAAYQRLLTGFLDAEPAHLIARDSSRAIVGVLPAFVSAPGAFGRVFNSLPFYGSNGGAVTAAGDREVAGQLLAAASAHAQSLQCAAATVISSPFDPADDVYARGFAHDMTDTRTGQVSELPPSGDSFEAQLAAQFHRKTRAAVQKAVNSPVTVASEPGGDALAFIVREHHAAIAAKQGLAKPDHFFAQVARTFEYGRDYETFIARLDGKPIAGLLLFYFNRTAEYFTPVVTPEYRPMQPLSRIIWEAMRAAAGRGLKYWNWGGTWASQTTLYSFKQRFGAIDRPYTYYTRIFNPQILTATPAQLLEQYPYFFVAPYRRLQSA